MKFRILALLLSTALLRAQGGGYGSCLQADSLANTPIGPSGNQVACRFRAKPGGTLLGVRPYIIWSFRKAGYHRGTGGILAVEIQTDDGSPAHRPSGQVLAANVQTLHLLPASDDFYSRIDFDRQPELKAGALYHVVFSNPHPRPEKNFVSLNAAFTVTAPKPLQPGLADEDWALLFRNRLHPAWAPRRTPGTQEGFTPILEVLYGKGGSQGVGYIEFWMGAAKPIGGAARVGELFTVSDSSRTVRGVAVRVRRVAGDGGLEAHLETPEGQVLAGGTSTGGPAPSPAGSLGGCAWVEVSFKAPVPLRRGGTYRLVLSSKQAKFEAFPMRKGLDKGFSGATVFSDGYAQFSNGGAWAGWEQWGQKGRKDSDIQFYFQPGGGY